MDYYKGSKIIRAMKVLKTEVIQGYPFITGLKVNDFDTGSQSRLKFKKNLFDARISDQTFTEGSLKSPPSGVVN